MFKLMAIVIVLATGTPNLLEHKDTFVSKEACEAQWENESNAAIQEYIAKHYGAVIEKDFLLRHECVDLDQGA